MLQIQDFSFHHQTDAVVLFCLQQNTVSLRHLLREQKREYLVKHLNILPSVTTFFFLWEYRTSTTSTVPVMILCWMLPLEILGGFSCWKKHTHLIAASKFNEKRRKYSLDRLLGWRRDLYSFGEASLFRMEIEDVCVRSHETTWLPHFLLILKGVKLHNSRCDDNGLLESEDWLSINASSFTMLNGSLQECKVAFQYYTACKMPSHSLLI